MTIPPLSSSEDESARSRPNDLVTGLREAFRARDALYPHHDYDLETVDGLGVTAFGDIRELVEALAAAPSEPSTAWRGIESAPRDGTFILATGGGLEESMDVIQYSPRTECWSCSQITLDDRDDEAEGYNRPTHWMPLPGAPS